MITASRPLWATSVLGALAGAFGGALLGVGALAFQSFVMNSPRFGNDGEAMGFGVIFVIFAIVAAGAGALGGALLGWAVVLWRSARRSLALAVFFIAGALALCWLRDALTALLPLVPAVALIARHLWARRAT